MKQVSISEFKKYLVPQIKKELPLEIIADGEIIAVILSFTDYKKMKMPLPQASIRFGQF